MEELGHLRNEVTQHLSDVFQLEKIVFAIVEKLEAHLTEVEVAREATDRKSMLEFLGRTRNGRK